MRVRKLLGEPMLHFLFMGVAMFAAYQRLSPRASNGSRIVVSQGVADDLAAQFQAQWGRQPVATELNHLVDGYVRDEILYREGVSLGLDRDDAVVKRRVRQKLEVMAEEAVASGTPTDAELSAYLAENPQRFTRPAIVSFVQVFLGRSVSGPAVERVAARTRDAVNSGRDPSMLGERSLLPRTMTETPVDLVARDFGAGFATVLARMPVGQWAGPVDSEFGAHLVRVTERTPAVVPPLSEVRAAVVREWENDRRKRALNDNYQKLKSKYDVRIEVNLPAIAP